jgi:hypothetical protein
MNLDDLQVIVSRDLPADEAWVVRRVDAPETGRLAPAPRRVRRRGHRGGSELSPPLDAAGPARPGWRRHQAHRGAGAVQRVGQHDDALRETFSPEVR